jgi:hypothetical protein
MRIAGGAALSRSSLKTFLGLLAVSVSLSACAGTLPVPGGTDDVNHSCFSSIADMQARILDMPVGMPEGEVFTRLCRKRDSMTRLDRRDIRVALLGGEAILFSGMDADSDSKATQKRTWVHQPDPHQDG